MRIHLRAVRHVGPARRAPAALVRAAGIAALGWAALSPPAASAQLGAAVHVTVHAAASPSPVPDGRPATASARATVPVPAATVSVRGSGAAAVTDSRGTAVLRALPPGPQTLVVSALAHAEATLEVHAVNGRVVRASVVLEPDPVRIRDLRVQVSREGTAAQTVVETASLPAGVADLAAALERVPGASVVRQGGAGAPATVRLRGAGSEQVLVLLDGTPLNSPLTGVADLSTVDLGSLARIRVIPGAQSARYGPRALGGVVVLESRAAVAHSGAAHAGTGSWSFVEAGARTSHGVGDDWSVSGGASWRRSGGAFTYAVPAFRGGGRARRENAAFEQTGGDVRVARRGSVDASLRAHASDLERGSPGTVAQPSLSARHRHRRRGLGARMEYAQRRLGGSARGAVQWQRAEYEDPSPSFGRAYDTRTRVRRAEFGLEGWWHPAGSSFRAGLDGARLDVRSSALAPAVVRIDEWGAWARAAHGRDVADGVRLGVAAAMRADRHDLVDGLSASPALELTLARGGLTLDLAWRRGFSPPGLGDLFFQEGVLVEPNPGLRPERIRGEVSASLAAAWSLGPARGQLRGTLYRAHLDDMILWFPDHRFVWSPDNYDVRRRGVEAGLLAEFPAFGRAHTLTADAVWSEVEYTGRALSGQVAYRPRFTADLALAIRLPGGVSLAPAATHVGARPTVPGSELNVLGAYTLLDAGIAIPLALGALSARVELTLTNLFDRGAALLVDYPLPGRGWSTRFRIGDAP